MASKDGVELNHCGMWEVFVGGEMVGITHSNREAWREYDKRAGELMSKSEATSEWYFNNLE